MEFLSEMMLLPIIASAVAVFVVSSIIWMATPLHKHDYKDPGDAEETIKSMVRGLKPGVYFVPWCHGKDGKGMKDPQVQRKMKEGPWANVIVQPGPPNMMKLLAAWVAHLLIVGLFVAFIVRASGVAHGDILVHREAASNFMTVFKLAAVSAFMTYGGYSLPLAIWHGLPWNQVPARVLDGVIYAALTGVLFGVLVK